MDDSEDEIPVPKPPKKRPRDSVGGGSTSGTPKRAENPSRDISWASLGAHKCKKCGFTTSEESLINVHSCHSRRALSSNGSGNRTANVTSAPPSSLSSSSSAAAAAVQTSLPSHTKAASAAANSSAVTRSSTASVSPSAKTSRRYVQRSTNGVTANAQPAGAFLLVPPPPVSLLPSAGFPQLRPNNVSTALNLNGRCAVSSITNSATQQLSRQVFLVSSPLTSMQSTSTLPAMSRVVIGGGTVISSCAPLDLTVGSARSAVSAIPGSAAEPCESSSVDFTVSTASLATVAPTSTASAAATPSTASLTSAMATASVTASTATSATVDVSSAKTETGLVLLTAESGKFSCSPCEFEGSGNVFLEHLICHLNSEAYHCLYCKERFSSRPAFSQHCKSAHSEQKMRCKLKNLKEGREIMETATKHGKASFPMRQKHSYCPKKNPVTEDAAVTVAPTSHSNRVSSAVPQRATVQSTVPPVPSGGDSVSQLRSVTQPSPSALPSEFAADPLAASSEGTAPQTSVGTDQQAGSSHGDPPALPVILSCEGNYTAHEESESSDAGSHPQRARVLNQAIANPDQNRPHTAERPPLPVSSRMPTTCLPRPQHQAGSHISMAGGQQQFPASCPTTVAVFGRPPQAPPAVRPTIARNPFMGSGPTPHTIPCSPAVNLFTPAQLRLQGYQNTQSVMAFNSFSLPQISAVQPAYQFTGPYARRPMLAQTNRPQMTNLPLSAQQAYGLGQSAMGTHMLPTFSYFANQHRQTIQQPLTHQGPSLAQSLAPQQQSLAANSQMAASARYSPISPPSARSLIRPPNPAIAQLQFSSSSAENNGIVTAPPPSTVANSPTVCSMDRSDRQDWSNSGSSTAINGVEKTLAAGGISSASDTDLQVVVANSPAGSTVAVKQEASRAYQTAVVVGSSSGRASHSPLVASPSASPSPPTAQAAGDTSTELPQYMRRNNTYICLACKKKIGTENVMYDHVWHHRHPGGETCSSCSVDDSGNSVCLQTKTEVENIPSKVSPSILNLLTRPAVRTRLLQNQKLFSTDGSEDRASPGLSSKDTTTAAEKPVENVNEQQPEKEREENTSTPVPVTTEPGSAVARQPLKAEDSEHQGQPVHEETVAPVQPVTAIDSVGGDIDTANKEDPPHMSEDVPTPITEKETVVTAPEGNPDSVEEQHSDGEVSSPVVPPVEVQSESTDVHEDTVATAAAYDKAPACVMDSLLDSDSSSDGTPALCIAEGTESCEQESQESDDASGDVRPEAPSTQGNDLGGDGLKAVCEARPSCEPEPTHNPAADSGSAEPQEDNPPDGQTDGRSHNGPEHAGASPPPCAASQSQVDAEPTRQAPGSPHAETEATELAEPCVSAEESKSPEKGDVPIESTDTSCSRPIEADAGQNAADGEAETGESARELLQEENVRQGTENQGSAGVGQPDAVDPVDMFYACSLCDYRCVMAVDFSEHLSSQHHDADVFSCHHCSYQGHYYTHLTNHIHQHTSGPPEMYLCPVCSYRTNKLKGLSHHITADHSLSSTFRCKTCGTTLSHQQEFIAHLQENSLTMFGCSQCSARFLTKQAIRQHCQIHHSGTGFHRVVKMLLCYDRKLNNHPMPAPAAVKSSPMKNSVQPATNDAEDNHATENRLPEPSGEEATTVTTSPCHAVNPSQGPHTTVTPSAVEMGSEPRTSPKASDADRTSAVMGSESNASANTSGADSAGETSATQSPSLPLSIAASLGLMARPACSTATTSAVTETSSRLLDLFGMQEMHQAIKGWLYREEGQSVYICLYCDKRFVSLRLIHGHLFTHNRVPVVCCMYCEKAAVSKRIMKQHIRETHSGASTSVHYVTVNKDDLLTKLKTCRSAVEPIVQFKLMCSQITKDFEEVIPEPEKTADTSVHLAGATHVPKVETFVDKDTDSSGESPTRRGAYPAEREMREKDSSDASNADFEQEGSSSQSILEEDQCVPASVCDRSQPASDPIPARNRPLESVFEKNLLLSGSVLEEKQPLPISSPRHISPEGNMSHFSSNSKESSPTTASPPKEKQPLSSSKPQETQSAFSSIPEEERPASTSTPEVERPVPAKVSGAADQKGKHASNRTAASMPSTTSHTAETQRNVTPSPSKVRKKGSARSSPSPSKVDRKCKMSSALVANLVVGGMRMFMCKACQIRRLKKNSMLKHLESCPRLQASQDVSQHTKAAQRLVRQRSTGTKAGLAKRVLSFSVCQDEEKDSPKAQNSHIEKEDGSSDSEVELPSQRKRSRAAALVVSSGDESEPVVPRKKQRHISSSSSCDVSDEENTAAELLVKLKCKHCHFSLPKAEAEDRALRQHLLDAHEKMTKLSKCGHCSFLYATTMTSMFKNHIRSQHPGLPEKSEPVPWIMFFDEVEEEASLSSQSLSSQQTTDGYSPSEDKENNSGSQGKGLESSTSDSPEGLRKIGQRNGTHTTNKKKSRKRARRNSADDDSESGSDSDSSRRRGAHLKKKPTAKHAKRTLTNQLADSADSDSYDADSTEAFTTENGPDGGKQKCKKLTTKNTKILNSRKHPVLQKSSNVKATAVSSHSSPDKAQPGMNRAVPKKSVSASSNGAEKGNSPARNQPNNTSMAAAMTNITTDKETANTNQAPDYFRFICTECGKRSTDRRCMKQHISKHIGYKEMTCAHCQMLFYTLRELEAHSSKEHPNLPVQKTVQRSPELVLKLNRLVQEAEEKGKKERVPVTEPQDPCMPDEPVQLSSSEPATARSLLRVKQGIQCVRCDQKFDCLSEFKDHHQSSHSGEIMEWRDVGTGGVYDMKGTLLVEGNCTLPPQHKYLCGFCSYRSSHRTILHLHRETAHEKNWDWIVILRTSRLAKPSGTYAKGSSSHSTTVGEERPSASGASSGTENIHSSAATSPEQVSDSSSLGHQDEETVGDVSLSDSRKPVVKLDDFVTLRLRREAAFKDWFRRTGLQGFDLYGLDEDIIRAFLPRKPSSSLEHSRQQGPE